VRIIRESPELHYLFLNKADSYLKKIKESVDCFDNEWREVGDEGFYELPPGAPYPPSYHREAFNLLLALGRTIVELYAIEKDNKYLNKAERLARFFKSRLTLGLNNSYNWTYTSEHTTVEDISHGAIEVDFAVLCYRNSIVFTKQDLQRFANTLIEVVQQPDGTLAMYVDGTGVSDVQYTTQCFRWLELTLVDKRLYDLCKNIYNEYGDQIIGFIIEGNHIIISSQLGYAMLLKWEYILNN